MSRITLHPSAEALIQTSYAAGRSAPADEDAAAEAMASHFSAYGIKPGTPAAEAWCLGYWEARRDEEGNAA